MLDLDVMSDLECFVARIRCAAATPPKPVTDTAALASLANVLHEVDMRLDGASRRPDGNCTAKA